MSPIDRDHHVPKHPRAATDPAVPVAIPHEPVTGRYDTFAEEQAARIRRDVHEQMLKGNRAIAIKVGAGNRFVRDRVGGLVERLDAIETMLKASAEERERRRAEEIEHKIRRDKFLRFLITKAAPILVALAGVITAIAAFKDKLP